MVIDQAFEALLWRLATVVAGASVEISDEGPWVVGLHLHAQCIVVRVALRFVETRCGRH